MTSMRILPAKENHIPKSNSNRNLGAREVAHNKPIIAMNTHLLNFNSQIRQPNVRNYEANEIIESEKNDKKCENHPMKNAEFIIEIED